MSAPSSPSSSPAPPTPPTEPRPANQPNVLYDQPSPARSDASLVSVELSPDEIAREINEHFAGIAFWMKRGGLTATYVQTATEASEGTRHYNVDELPNGRRLPLQTDNALLKLEVMLSTLKEWITSDMDIEDLEYHSNHPGNIFHQTIHLMFGQLFDLQTKLEELRVSGASGASGAGGASKDNFMKAPNRLRL